MEHNNSGRCLDNWNMLNVPLGFDQGAGRNVASEDVANVCIFDERELDAETDDDAKNKQADTELKHSQATHGAIRSIKDEDKHDVDNGDGDTSYERQLGNQ